MKHAVDEDIVVVDPNSVDLPWCLDRTQQMLGSVYKSAADYFNSCPVVELCDVFVGAQGSEISWSVPMDLETLGVAAAMAQAPLALRGSTDRGKTALAERLLAGMFGKHGQGWWRMEVNRGMSIDDLIDIDVRKLTESTLSEAMASARWLSLPARLLDEVNRAHAKLLNLAIHLADGSGFNVRGDLNIPVGMPYRVGEQTKRYSFTITTANHQTEEYAGTYEEDQAMTRRVVVSVDLDEIPQSTADRCQMLNKRRAKAALRPGRSSAVEMIQLYEALPEAIPCSALAYLFLHYLAGMNTCVRTRSGQLRPQLKPGICNECHLAKAHRFCGRVGGVSEGLLLGVQDLARALALVRAATVLTRLRHQCCGRAKRGLRAAKLQRVLGTRATGTKLYEKFKQAYLERLRVCGEDVKAAYVLVAPTHVWVDPNWLASQPAFERNHLYVAREVAKEGWSAMLRFLREHAELIGALACSREVSAADQSAIEDYVTNRDAAMLSVINALRDEELPMHFREQLQGRHSEVA